MNKFAKAVVKCRIPIVIVSLLLLIPAVFGMLQTRINYDMLNYLPDSMETVQGQDILMDKFGKGAFSFVICEGMEDREVAVLKDKIEAVEHVDTVVWYDTLADLGVPKQILPEKLYNAFNSDNDTMMAVFFDSSTSADATIDAITEIRGIAGKQCFISGMSALVTDLRNLCEQEEPIYVAIAVVLACAVMMLFMDSFLIPFVFLAGIGITIVYNLGTNLFLGEISYITKALSAVLQLAVTMDYSIFLWHSYTEQYERCGGDKQLAMQNAIQQTVTSVFGSSLTTIAGFIALCFMSFTLGSDLGLVMAKGVLLGVIGCVTILPSLILVLDRPIRKTRHRALVPKFERLSGFVVKRSWIFLLVFLVALAPALYGYAKTNDSVYYDLSRSLPQDMDYMIANTKLSEKFDVSTTHMVLCDSSVSAKSKKNMLKEIEQVAGVKYALGLQSVVGSLVPEEFIPDSVTEVLKSDKWELMLVNSAYSVATDEQAQQLQSIKDIIKKYDEKGMLIGEASCTQDMINVTDVDFRNVSIISIAAIFVIIAVVLKSVSLPFILVAVIELAIFINLGLPFYTATELPFIAPICISTIQLGATVDYAILMTTRYKQERFAGLAKKDAIQRSLRSSIPSIVVSALGFFAATFGVGLYSNVDMISAMCNLMARGAIISMLCVVLILPAMFVLFDKVIIHTSLGFINKSGKEAK